MVKIENFREKNLSLRDDGRAVPGRMREKTLSWERVAGRSPDGCGAVRRTDLVPPLFRRCGGTFPQGKVRERPRRRKPSPTGKVARRKA